MNNIYKQWLDFKKNSEFASSLTAAKKIGITEAELIASRVGIDATALKPDWQEILSSMDRFGQVMAFTRNEHCIHERKGIYKKPIIAKKSNTGLIISPDIDLRFIFDFWNSAFAVSDIVPQKIAASGELKSIQFFDKYGDATHKIYLINTDQSLEWDSFIDQLKLPNQLNSLQIENKPANPVTAENSTINIPSFKSDWQAMTDPHQFEGLLKQYKITRPQAFRLIGEEYAKLLPVNALPTLLQKISEEKFKVMIFVGNRGCVQIHTGLIENLKWSNGWFNVLDPLFDLHLKAEYIAQLWLIRKPTSEGIISSIEAYDSEGTLIIQLYGARRADAADYNAWCNFIDNCNIN